MLQINIIILIVTLSIFGNEINLMKNANYYSVIFITKFKDSRKI